MRGRMARVVVGDVGVIGDGMPPGDHRHAAANPALDEQMHVDAREQFQLHLGHLQHGVPAEARRGVVVCRVKTVMRHTRGAELLEDVGEQKGVGEQVQIVVLCERRHAEGGPHLLGVDVVGVADVGLREAAVEGRLGWEMRLLQSCGSVKVVVWEDALPFLQLGVVGVPFQVRESIDRQVGQQLLQRGRHKLEAVDEAQPAE